MKTIADMSDEELRVEIERRKTPATLPAPVVLGSELAERADNIKRLINAIDTLVGFLNGTVPEMNRAFWQSVAEKHPDVDMQSYHWEAEDGCLVPKQKPVVTDTQEVQTC